MLYWITSIAALAGVWLNIKKNVACFYIWAATNAVWCYVDYERDILAQAALQAVYFGLSLYGIWAWTISRRKQP